MLGHGSGRGVSQHGHSSMGNTYQAFVPGGCRAAFWARLLSTHPILVAAKHVVFR